MKRKGYIRLVGANETAEQAKSARGEKVRGGEIGGGLLYYFLNLGEDGTVPACPNESYEKLKKIEDYLNLQELSACDALIENLLKEGYISNAQQELLLGLPYVYFDAFIAWLDAMPGVRLTID